MRSLAEKYSSLGDHEKGMSYINRADALAKKLLPRQEHCEILWNSVAKVEILLRQKEETHLKEAVLIAQGAYSLA